MNPHQKAAHYYRDKEMCCIPVGPDKRPLVAWKEYQERYPSDSEIAEWWPDGKANIALLTGPISGNLAVLDVDDPALAERMASDAFLQQRTVMVGTPRGGLHIYVIETDGPSASGPLVPGVADLKAQGGYIICPPSASEKGPYRTISRGKPMRVDNAREWALGLLRAYDVPLGGSRGTRLYKDALKPHVEVKQGARNSTLASLAGKLRTSLQLTEGLDVLRAYNARLKPPLPDDEVQKIANSVWRYGGPTPEAEAVLVNMATVQPERVRWLWPGRIPLGKLTVVAGPSGTGKSTMLLDIGARVTQGSFLPDDSTAPQGDVILLTAEDGLADTVRPRLDLAGADSSRVHAITMVRQGEAEHMFSLEDDLPTLEKSITDKDARLAIIDPLLAYTGTGDSYKDAEMRRLLAPLAGIAERTGCAIVGVMHLNKRGGERSPLNRITAAVAFVAAARSVLLLAEDPDDESGERRILAPVKMNLCAMPPSLALHFAEDGGLTWDGPVDKRAAQLLVEGDAERGALAEAKDFLRAILADGKVEAKEVRREARNADIKDRTLERAKAELKIKSPRDGFGPGSVCYWELPTDRHRSPSAPYKDDWRSMEPSDTKEGREAQDLAIYDGASRLPADLQSDPWEAESQCHP